MRADRGRQHLLARVGDLKGDAEVSSICGKRYDQAERERIALTRLLTVNEHETAGIRFPRPPVNPQITRKTVLRHRIGFAVVTKLVILQATDNRKQRRRMPRPLRTSLPQQFKSVGILQGTKFGTEGLDGRRDTVAAEHVDIAVHII